MLGVTCFKSYRHVSTLNFNVTKHENRLPKNDS